MNRHWNSYLNQTLSRRDLLQVRAPASAAWRWPGCLAQEQARRERSADPLAVKAPHFPARAKRVIFLFMHGGPSQVDTFDYKPLLKRDHGKPLPFARPKVVSSETCNLLQSPWAFRQYGQSGAWVSELFPHVAEVRRRPLLHQVDARLELAAWRGAAGIAHRLRHVRPAEHGFVDHLRPGHARTRDAGLHHDLPDADPRRREQLRLGVSAGALSGHADRVGGIPARDAKIPFITNKETPREIQRMELDYTQELNREAAGVDGSGSCAGGADRVVRAGVPHAGGSAGAAGYQRRDRKRREKLYGLDNPITEDFGRQCLMARRFSENGVRFVQVSHTYKWDQHENLKRDHEQNAAEVDKPIAALLTDLKARGLLEDTLVLWGGEFGRTPTAQGSDGRDHNPEASRCGWPAAA